MKITMRLYRLHDLDLIYLYKMPNVSIQRIIKVVLKTYVQDRKNGRINKRIQIPRIEHEKKLPQSAQFHIYLNEGEDDEVIEWINITPKGCRNSMIKNILRTYLDFPVTTPYETETDEKPKTNDDLINQLNDSMNATTAKKTSRTSKSVEKPSQQTSVNKSVNQPSSSNKLNDDVIIDTVKQKTEPSNPESTSAPVVATTVEKPPKEFKEGDYSDDLFDDFESMMDSF